MAPKCQLHNAATIAETIILDSLFRRGFNGTAGSSANRAYCFPHLKRFNITEMLGSPEMIKLNSKWWLAALFLVCSTSMSFADRDQREQDRDGHRRRRVPEGGFSVVYLLGAGMTCLGAMVIRSRMAKSSLSS
jgi:hypothetical protein